VELLLAIPESKAAGGSSTRSRGPSTLLLPSIRRGPKRLRGMKTRPCSGQQANPLPDSLTSSVALTQ